MDVWHGRLIALRLAGNRRETKVIDGLSRGWGKCKEYALMATVRKIRETAREATERTEASANKTAEGLRECQIMILAATQANINAMFEYMQEAFSAKSVPELMEVSTRYAQRQMQMITEQAREIGSAMQKATVDSSRSFIDLGNTFGRSS
jgi:hypothetical protein